MRTILVLIFVIGFSFLLHLPWVGYASPPRCAGMVDSSTQPASDAYRGLFTQVQISSPKNLADGSFEKVWPQLIKEVSEWAMEQAFEIPVAVDLMDPIYPDQPLPDLMPAHLVDLFNKARELNYERTKNSWLEIWPYGGEFSALEGRLKVSVINYSEHYYKQFFTETSSTWGRIPQYLAVRVERLVPYRDFAFPQHPLDQTDDIENTKVSFVSEIVFESTIEGSLYLRERSERTFLQLDQFNNEIRFKNESLTAIEDHQDLSFLKRLVQKRKVFHLDYSSQFLGDNNFDVLQDHPVRLHAGNLKRFISMINNPHRKFHVFLISPYLKTDALQPSEAYYLNPKRTAHALLGLSQVFYITDLNEFDEACKNLGYNFFESYNGEARLFRIGYRIEKNEVLDAKTFPLIRIDQLRKFQRPLLDRETSILDNEAHPLYKFKKYLVVNWLNAHIRPDQLIPESTGVALKSRFREEHSPLTFEGVKDLVQKNSKKEFINRKNDANNTSFSKKKNNSPTYVRGVKQFNWKRRRSSRRSDS